MPDDSAVSISTASLTAGFDPEVIIKKALGRGGEFAEIYLEDTLNTSIICDEDKIEKVVAGRDRGCGIRVISALKTYYAYTNDFSSSSLIELASLVADAVGEGKDPGDISLLKRAVAMSANVVVPPSGVELSRKIAHVNTANSAARGFDKRVDQVRVVYGDAFRSTSIINSLGDWHEEDRTSILFLAQVIAKEGDVVQTGYEPIGGTLGFEIFDDNPPEGVAEKAADLAVSMLGAGRIEGGKMSVVLSSTAGGTMIHEAVGHGLEADLANQGLSVYAGKVGEKIASPIITVIDDGTVATKRGTSHFDGEGTPTRRNVLVENGILKTYMYDRLAAMKAGVESTGNGRRESYQHRPIPRMTTTMIAPGESDPDEILTSLDSGLFVRKMGGGQVNTVTGDFVFEVTEGYRVENGKVGEPVRGATLTGNGPDVLGAIDMVGTDLGYGLGTCGKDGQGVPVADAQPTIRIPEIVVGGSAG